jgi:hypothetical protein
VPLLVKQFDGLNSTQKDGGTGTAAIATDLSYVMEGVDNAIAIYRTATGAVAYGPYAPSSFFTPVYHAGDTFANPQMYYDTMRDHWIVVYLEVAPSGAYTYLDVAVSQTNSPTQPTPGGQYNVYQFGTDFEGTPTISTYCASQRLGVDYWALYIACADNKIVLGHPLFAGNTVFAISKAPLLTGAANPPTYWWNDALKIAGDAAPAIALSAALEEGVQGAEFIVGNDTGYGVLSDNLSVCALTNLSNISTVTPTLTCAHTTLPNGGHYDPLPARQPGGPNIAVPFALSQVYYKAGHLFLAWTSGDLGRDDIIWVEARPELDLSRIDVLQHAGVGNYDANRNTDAYAPSIVGTDEDDIVVAYTSSNVNAVGSWVPSLHYNGRKAAGALYYMGSNFSDATVITGTHATTASWAIYSSCAISLNSVTRGTIWCVGEYPGSVPDPGWNTRIFNLRAE